MNDVYQRLRVKETLLCLCSFSLAKESLGWPCPVLIDYKHSDVYYHTGYNISVKNIIKAQEKLDKIGWFCCLGSILLKQAT